jgi:hypothetical protein
METHREPTLRSGWMVHGDLIILLDDRRNMLRASSGDWDSQRPLMKISITSYENRNRVNILLGKIVLKGFSGQS